MKTVWRVRLHTDGLGQRMRHRAVRKGAEQPALAVPLEIARPRSSAFPRLPTVYPAAFPLEPLPRPSLWSHSRGPTPGGGACPAPAMRCLAAGEAGMAGGVAQKGLLNFLSAQRRLHDGIVERPPHSRTDRQMQCSNSRASLPLD
jgi:hypothetical protein